MATKMLESSAVSAFCESAAVMHSAGIQMDEAVFLLGEKMCIRDRPETAYSTPSMTKRSASTPLADFSAPS